MFNRKLKERVAALERRLDEFEKVSDQDIKDMSEKIVKTISRFQSDLPTKNDIVSDENR